MHPRITVHVHGLVNWRIIVISGASISNWSTVRRLALHHAVDVLGPYGQAGGRLVARVSVTTGPHLCSIADSLETIGYGHCLNSHNKINQNT